MSNPELSQDRELVECAKAMMEAWYGTPLPFNVANYSERWLLAADAARTFFGSGYRLPEANVANAERLAKAVGSSSFVPWSVWVKDAQAYLRAMHAAFGEPEPKPEKPEPVFLSPEQADALEDAAQKRHAEMAEDRSGFPENWADEANRMDKRREMILALAANPEMMRRALERSGSREVCARWLVEWADALVEAACKK